MTHKGLHQLLVIDRRYWFPMKSSFFVSTCSSNVSHMQGHLPGGFSIHCEKNKETISNSGRRIQFLLCFSFSACSKADGRCKSTRCRSGASAGPFNLAFRSAIDICRSIASACVHLPPWRSGNHPEHFFFYRFDRVSTAERPADNHPFFFYTVDPTTKRVQTFPPPPPRKKVLSFVRDVRNFERTPKAPVRFDCHLAQSQQSEKTFWSSLAQS